MSKTLPCRTLSTPFMPSDLSAPSMALPCGSRIPFLRVTKTRAFTGLNRVQEPYACARTGRNSLHQLRPMGARLFVLLQYSQAARHFGIGFNEPAKVAAKAILVELVVRLDIPQPARIRGNLVGDDDPHHLALP